MRFRGPERALRLALYIWDRGGIIPLDLYTLCLNYGYDMEHILNGSETRKAS